MTGKEIITRETPLGLYKGLGAVVTGIVPKMAIRFTSYDWYKQALSSNSAGAASGQATFLGKTPSQISNTLGRRKEIKRTRKKKTIKLFSRNLAGLAAGITEAVAVVTPMEVIKIRLQAQHHSMADPLAIPKYRNAAHALYTLIKEEGPSALYRGVSLTALRQGTNQAVNFTAYSYLKSYLQQRLHAEEAEEEEEGEDKGPSSSELPSYQTMLIGLVSGAMGPLSNAPIDTIKTRLQQTPGMAAKTTAIGRIVTIARDMFKQEGVHAFYKGITPRIMRVAPGQAVTFTVYEWLKGWLEAREGSLFGGFEE